MLAKSLVQKYNSLFYDKKIKVKMIKDIIEIIPKIAAKFTS